MSDLYWSCFISSDHQTFRYLQGRKFLADNFADLISIVKVHLHGRETAYLIANGLRGTLRISSTEVINALSPSFAKAEL